MKFDRQLRPATVTSWVVSYGGKTNNSKMADGRHFENRHFDISPYRSEKSSDFHEILYTAADFVRHVIYKNITSVSVELTQTRHSHST